MSKQVKSFAKTLFLPKTSFPLQNTLIREKNEEVLERITTFTYQQQQQQQHKENKVFSLLDGPPFANGRLHPGHFLNKVLKDANNRFQMSINKTIRFIPGWDCHGLPIELLATKEMKDDRSIVNIREKAKEFARSAIQSQSKDFRSWGVLADWNDLYTTMQPEYEAREIMILSKLLERGLIFRDLKPVFWSPKSRTALAEAELIYEDDHESKAVHVKFTLNPSSKLKRQLVSFGDENIIHLIAWTTTPWSLIGNMALAINEKEEYLFVSCKNYSKDEIFVIGSCRLEYFKKFLGQDVDVLSIKVKGEDLIGCQAVSPLSGDMVPVLTGEHVTVDSGTGIVHIAPVHGLEDWECYKKAFPDQKLKESDCRIDLNGKFKNDCGSAKIKGLPALKEGNASIIDILESKNKLVGKAENFRHRYPYDWRTKTPIIMMATKQFFITVGDTVEALAKEALKEVQFVPSQMKKRLISTLETRREWCISRQRSWGLPIPFYFRFNKQNEEETLINQEILSNFAKKCQKEGSDFWFKTNSNEDEVDKEILPKEYQNQGWKRGTDTLDVWFDSGSAWFASNSERDWNQLDDLVLEGSDQHRGWFQSSLLSRISSVWEPKAPFKAVVTHGFVLDKNGQKMSKSLGNVIYPEDAIKKCGGVDILRIWAITGDSFSADLKFSEETLSGARDTYRKLRNLLRFFCP